MLARLSKLNRNKLDAQAFLFIGYPVQRSAIWIPPEQERSKACGPVADAVNAARQPHQLALPYAPWTQSRHHSLRAMASSMSSAQTPDCGSRRRNRHAWVDIPQIDPCRQRWL